MASQSSNKTGKAFPFPPIPAGDGEEGLRSSLGEYMGSSRDLQGYGSPPSMSSLKGNRNNRSIEIDTIDDCDEKEYDFLVVSLGNHRFNQRCQVLRAGLYHPSIEYNVCPEESSELYFAADNKKRALSEESCDIIRKSAVLVLFLGDASLAPNEECTLPRECCVKLKKASRVANETPGCSVVVVYEGEIRPFPTLAIDKTVKYYGEEDRRFHKRMLSQLQKQWESTATSHTLDSPLAKRLSRTSSQLSQLEASLSTSGSLGSSFDSLRISTQLDAFTPRVCSIQKMVQESVPKGSPAGEWRELTPEEESELVAYITDKSQGEIPTKTQFQQIRDWIRMNHAKNRPPLTTHEMRDFIDNVFGNVGIAEGPINEPGKWDIFVSYTTRVRSGLDLFANLDLN